MLRDLQLDAAFFLPALNARQYPGDFVAGRSPVIAMIMVRIDQARADGRVGDKRALDFVLSLPALAQGMVSMLRANRFSDEKHFKNLFRIVLHQCIESFSSAPLGARMYSSPDADPVEDSVVVVKDGRIVSAGSRANTPVPPGVRVLDAHGAILTAGFWNSHIHFMTPDVLNAATAKAETLESGLQAMLTRWGFTTVFDLASSTDNTLALRRRINSGEIPGPMILTVGDPFFPKDGTPIYVRDFLKSQGWPSEDHDRGQGLRCRRGADPFRYGCRLHRCFRHQRRISTDVRCPRLEKNSKLPHHGSRRAVWVCHPQGTSRARNGRRSGLAGRGSRSRSDRLRASSDTIRGGRVIWSSDRG
jgi:hypothetical protein